MRYSRSTITGCRVLVKVPRFVFRTVFHQIFLKFGIFSRTIPILSKSEMVMSGGLVDLARYDPLSQINTILNKKNWVVVRDDKLKNIYLESNTVWDIGQRNIDQYALIRWHGETLVSPVLWLRTTVQFFADHCSFQWELNLVKKIVSQMNVKILNLLFH